MNKWLLLIAALLVATPVFAQATTGFTKVGNVTTPTYVDSSCPLQSSCYYQVTAVDSLGFESQPAQCSTTVLCFGGNQVVAIMPNSGTHTVTVSWLVSTGATSYNIYRHIGPLPPSSLSVVVN